MFSTRGKVCQVDFLEPLRGRVIANMNAKLSSSFTKEEVVRALKQMHHTKALRLDGMPPLFYQKHWSITGEAVMAIVLTILNIG